MSYYSQIALKTTTEGWILLNRLNDKIEKEEDKPLANLNAGKTVSGFYKIFHESIKWYDGSKQVQNFYSALAQMKEQCIPFLFIRIGEDIDDIEVRSHWTEDMPDEIETFEPQTEIYDEDEGSYEIILESGKEVKHRDLFTTKGYSEGDDV